MTILLCIPAFNEEDVIGDLIKKSLKFVDHVVVCDDGSSDKTSEIAENAGAYVIRHSENKGKGYALQSLFKYARHQNSKIIVTMDGDGQFKPDEIPKLCEPILNNGQDLVVGYRFDNNDEMPQYRKLGNKFLDQLSNLKLHDTQSGFRAYSKDAIKKITLSTDGFGADAQILMDAVKKGLRISEEKVTVLYNINSKTSTKNAISLGAEIATTIIKQILIQRPLLYLGLPGTVFVILGIISTTYLITVFNETGYFSVPFTLLSSSFLIFGTMLILFAGVLFSINKTKTS